MSRDLWMRQFRIRNLSTPEQRGRAVALFLKLEMLAYLVIFLGVAIVIIKAII